jgi:phosphatidylglycerol phospholipase C
MEGSRPTRLLGGQSGASQTPKLHTDALHHADASLAAVSPRGAPPSLPAAVAHRGFCAALPENTMPAFGAALAAGAHAIETDLHLTADGVVVLSHDATLRRCFGRPERVADLDYADLARLRTLREPPSPMPRLVDLLALLARPEHAHVWLLLDVKRDDDARALLEAAAAAIASVPEGEGEGEEGGVGGGWRWIERISLGCWDARYVKLAREALPGFAAAYTGWDLGYARELLRAGAGVDFNLLYLSVAAPGGKGFLRECARQGRRVHLWTVNEERWMEWAIGREGVTSVITDDPVKYLEVCRRVEGRKGSASNKGTLRAMFRIAVFQVLLLLYRGLMRARLGSARKRIAQYLG